MFRNNYSSLIQGDLQSLNSAKNCSLTVYQNQIIFIYKLFIHIYYYYYYITVF